ncbi:MAG TPA: relaxase/mobilization nuclease domain-containing protein [Xanthobacteraceae bacterium]|jgi:hypothetical protein|nr:relaxase/mobilization nuclease domain-containing protein [Xanthobacteraceae bacterium]
MIVKILSNGKSFKGLSDYLTHDPDHAKTSERVAWTYTYNLANDDVPCAVGEMIWTARDAELLKQETGIRAGGRTTEDPAKHISLSWAPTETPSPEHMRESAEEFLRHMKWNEHQAIVIAHQDKQPHLHIMLSVIHPETGLRLDDNFERRRAQAWAKEYERENGIHCEQRFKNADEREKSMPRNIWMSFQENKKEFEKAEKIMAAEVEKSEENPKYRKNAEWEILKEIQKKERLEFFSEGKEHFRNLRTSIYREVREEYRFKWSEYYTAERNGDLKPELLEKWKERLVTEQKADLEFRRDEACSDLRASRGIEYRSLLEDQKESRAHLRSCQTLGVDSLEALRSQRRPEFTQEISSAFREAATEVTQPQSGQQGERRKDHNAGREDKTSGPDGNVPSLALGAFRLFDSLLSAFEGPPSRAGHRHGPTSFEIAADDACKQHQHSKLEEEDAERRKRQRAHSWE